MLYIPPDKIYRPVAARTAECLALPQRICRHRSCRRKNACLWHFSGNQEPCCLFNLTAAQRAAFDELYDLTIRVLQHGGYNELYYASDDPVLRELEDAAVAVARCCVHKSERDHFDKYRRMREKLPPPRKA